MNKSNLTANDIEKFRVAKLSRGNLSLQRGLWSSSHESKQRKEAIMDQLPKTLEKLSQAIKIHNDGSKTAASKNIL